MQHKRIGLWVRVLTAATFLGIAERSRGELVLVDEGVSLAPIVLAADVGPDTRRAADELAGYIEKISGARPEVLEGEPDPLPDDLI